MLNCGDRPPVAVQGCARRNAWNVGERLWLGVRVSVCGLIVLVVLSACGKTVSPRSDLADLQLRSQERLFHQVKSEFLAARYDEAIDAARRLLTTHPKTAFAPEANVLLARSYHEQGQREQATATFQQLLKDPRAAAFHDVARAYLEEEVPEVEPPRATGDAVAIRMTLGQWLPTENQRTVLKRMAVRGVTAQVIGVGCELSEAERALFAGDGRNSGGAVAARQMNDWFRRGVAIAHEEGLAVYLGVNLRCLGQIAPKMTAGWRDRSYDATSRAVRPTTYFDIFHPDYQAYIVRTLSRVARLGVDGMIFLSDAPLGVRDGLSTTALAAFQRVFRQPFQPRQVLATWQPSEAMSSGSVGSAGKGGASTIPEDTTLWRWLGWKARERVHVLSKIMKEMRQVRPRIQIALEVQAASIEQPVRALVHWSEDLLEANRAKFSFFLVASRLEAPVPSQWVSSPLDGPRASAGGLRVMALSFVQAFKDPTKVWMTAPRTLNRKSWSAQSMQGVFGRGDLPQGVGVVYDLRPVS